MKTKTKEDERKKKKEGIVEGCLLFSFDLGNVFWSKFGRFFEDSNGLEFLEFWIELLFGRWREFEFVVIRAWIQFGKKSWCNLIPYLFTSIFFYPLSFFSSHLSVNPNPRLYFLIPLSLSQLISYIDLYLFLFPCQS